MGSVNSSSGSLSSFGSLSGKEWTISAPGAQTYDFMQWARGTEVGTVRVASRRVTSFFAVHHCVILVGAIERNGVPLYAVFEWMDDCYDNYHRYATDRIHPDAHWCVFNFGTASIDQLLSAAARASKGRGYSVSDYNCNHWTEMVAHHLGRGLTVHWNCACVLPWKDNSASDIA